MAVESRQLVSCEGLGRGERTIMGNKLKKHWEELEGRSKEETWYVKVEREYKLFRGSGT